MLRNDETTAMFCGIDYIYGVSCFGFSRYSSSAQPQEIELGISELVLVGGTENMTQAPFAVRNIRFGTHFGQGLKAGDVDLRPSFQMVAHC